MQADSPSAVRASFPSLSMGIPAWNIPPTKNAPFGFQTLV